MFHRNSFNRKSIQIKDFIMSRFVCIAYFPKIIYCSRKCWSVLLKVTAEGLGNILFNFEDETNIVFLSWSPYWPPSLPACCLNWRRKPPMEPWYAKISFNHLVQWWPLMTKTQFWKGSFLGAFFTWSQRKRPALARLKTSLRRWFGLDKVRVLWIQFLVDWLFRI